MSDIGRRIPAGGMAAGQIGGDDSHFRLMNADTLPERDRIMAEIETRDAAQHPSALGERDKGKLRQSLEALHRNAELAEICLRRLESAIVTIEGPTPQEVGEKTPDSSDEREPPILQSLAEGNAIMNGNLQHIERCVTRLEALL